MKLVLALALLASIQTNAQVIEWSVFHLDPHLEYDKIHSPEECRLKTFSQKVELDERYRVLSLQDWFKPGFAYRMRVTGRNTKSQTECVVIGESKFYFFSIVGEF